MTTPTAWQTRAGCLDADPDLFFSTDPAERAEAQRICGGCPVRTDCLTFALEHNGAGHDFGIWGGTDPDARRGLRNTADADAPAAGANSEAVGPPAPIELPPARVEPAAPMVDVVRHPDGVYTDPTGRVTVVKVDTLPRWVLLIDDRAIDRCSTLTVARAVAFDSLAGLEAAA